MLYEKLPPRVEAEQYDGTPESIERIHALCKENRLYSEHIRTDYFGDDGIEVHPLDYDGSQPPQRVFVSAGEWLVVDDDGEPSKWSDERFRLKFVKV